jgi:uncharacterized protein (TIRG00374 family)
MRGTLRKSLFAVLMLAALAAFAYRSRGAIHIQDFSWSRLKVAIEGARLGLLLASLAAIYVAYAVRSLRWIRFCRFMGPSRFSAVYSATLMGFAAIFLLGRAGEPVRPLLLARKCRFSVSSMFGIYVLERLLDASAAAALAGVSLLVLPGLISSDAADAGWDLKMRASAGALFVGLFGFVALLVYFRLHGAGVLDRRLAGWRATPGWRRRLAAQFSGFSEGLQAIRSLSDLSAALFYSAVHWTLIAAIYWLVMRAFGGATAASGMRGAVVVLTLTMVGSLVQLPGVGGGTQIASFIALNSILAVEQEPAMAVTIVLWLVTFAGVCLVGVPLLIREGWSMGDLRRMARAEADAEESGKHLSEAKAKSLSARER